MRTSTDIRNKGPEITMRIMARILFSTPRAVSGCFAWGVEFVDVLTTDGLEDFSE
jgi:hypothetical protein